MAHAANNTNPNPAERPALDARTPPRAQPRGNGSARAYPKRERHPARPATPASNNFARLSEQSNYLR